MKATHDTLIIRADNHQVAEQQDTVATEVPFSLLVNGENLVSLLCSPSELDAMAVGFLLSEGLLKEREALVSVDVDETTTTVSVRIKNLPEDWQTMFHRKSITSGCGKGITFTDARRLDDSQPLRADLRVRISSIVALLKEFRDISKLFKETGGVHSAALCDADRLLFFSEDIGRHNAVDKLIGKAFLNQVPLTDKMLFSSGRISGEIMTKVVRSRIPILVSRAAPTCMAVVAAEDHGVTLIGFARGRRMNIYTHPQRLLFDNAAS